MIFGNPSVLLIATQYLCNGCHLCHGPCHVPAPLLSYGTAQNPHTSPLIYQVAPFCPACHFGILVFPDLLLKDGAIYLSLDNIPPVNDPLHCSHRHSGKVLGSCYHLRWYGLLYPAGMAIR